MFARLYEFEGTEGPSSFAWRLYTYVLFMTPLHIPRARSSAMCRYMCTDCLDWLTRQTLTNLFCDPAPHSPPANREGC